MNDLNDLSLVAGCFLGGGTFTLPSGNFSKKKGMMIRPYDQGL